MDLLLPALLETLVYADLFDYPLKLGEIGRFLIGRRAFELSQIKAGLEELVARNLIDRRDDCFFLRGRQGLTQARAKREPLTAEKLRRLEPLIKIFSRIPFIKLVGLTGAAAMGNSDETDDLDLMIVTTRRRMWLARFIVFSFLKALGLKRQNSRDDPNGKICINLWCDQDNMVVPEGDRDLVVAHEIAQMKPLANKDQTYERFVEQNLWLTQFLANWKV